MMRSISPVRAVQARISSRWGVGSTPSARSMRASSAWNAGSSSFQLLLRATLQAVVGERAGGGDVAQVEVMAGVRDPRERVEWLGFQLVRGGKVCARGGDVAQGVGGDGPTGQ